MKLQSSLLALVGIGMAAVVVAQTDINKATVPGIVNFGYIGKTVACAGATAPTALAEVKTLGYAAVINLRVVSEPGADIDASAAAGQAAGLRFIHLPVNASAPMCIAISIISPSACRPADLPTCRPADLPTCRPCRPCR